MRTNTKQSLRRGFVDGPYGQLHYRHGVPPQDEGRNPLVFLHMSPKSGRMFNRIAIQMMQDRVVLAPDYPGYGESDLPPADPPVTVADYARSVWAVVDALGLRSADFVGSHTGALVVTEVAAQHPDRAGRLVLLSAPLATADELNAFRRYYEPIPLDRDGQRFAEMWARIVEYRGEGVSLEMMAESMAENMRGGEAYEWGHRAAFDYMEHHFFDTLTELKNPLLVVNPKDDLWEHTRRMAKHLPDQAYVERNDWQNGFLDTRTEQVAALLRGFLDQVS